MKTEINDDKVIATVLKAKGIRVLIKFAPDLQGLRIQAGLQQELDELKKEMPNLTEEEAVEVLEFLFISIMNRLL